MDSYPDLDVMVEKGQQDHWVYPELLTRWKDRIAALEPTVLDEGGYYAWAHSLASQHPHELPAVVVIGQLGDFRQRLRDDAARVMRMLRSYQAATYEPEMVPHQIEDGIECFSDYWERVFVVSYRDRADYPYWPLLRLQMYTPLTLLRVGGNVAWRAAAVS